MRTATTRSTMKLFGSVLCVTVTVSTFLSHGAKADTTAHKAVLLEQPSETQPQPYIVGGEQTPQNTYPFVAAIQNGHAGRVVISAGSGTVSLMSGSTRRNFSADTIICGLYPDANDLCGSGQARGKICVMGFDFFRVGVLPETPSQQLDRCARAGGVAGIFIESSNGSVGIDHVRQSTANIPAINAGPILDNSLASALLDESGAFTFTHELSDFGFCTGSYLGDRWVATAAHCVTDLSGTLSNLPSEISVTVGVSDISSSRAKSEAIFVEEIVVSPSYRVDNTDTIRDDWALLRLASEPASGSAIRVATPTNLNQARDQASDVTVMGWGLLSRYGPGTSQPDRPANPERTSTLRHTTISLADTDTCNQGFLRFNDRFQNGDRSRLHVMGEGEICHAARNFDSNVCHGDSGGPSVITVDGELQLVGATSWGPGPGCAYGFDGSYAVSTSLSHIASTLSATTGFNVLPPTQSVAPEGGTGTTSSGGGGGSLSWATFLCLVWFRWVQRRGRGSQRQVQL